MSNKGISENEATPSHHPIIDGILHEINHPAMGLFHLFTPPAPVRPKCDLFTQSHVDKQW